MKQEFHPSRGRRITLVLEVVLLFAGAMFGSFLVFLGIGTLVGNPSNWFQWLATLWLLVMTIWALLRMSNVWRKLHYGISVSGDGFLIYGTEVSWSDVIGVDTGPRGEYVSLKIQKGPSSGRHLHIRRRDVADFGLLVAQIEKLARIGARIP